MKKQLVVSIILGTVLFFGIAPSALAKLPSPGMKIDLGRTALVVIDPQNDFLSSKGVTLGVVGRSMTENKTVENIEKLFKTAKANRIPVLFLPTIITPPITAGSLRGHLRC